MTTEPWGRLQELFDEACSLDQNEREAFLSEACGDDSDLRREISELLRYAENSDDALDGPAVGNVAAVLTQRAEDHGVIGTMIGPYRIVKQIGLGGFGDVYLGLRTDEFVQMVAIKLLRQDLLLSDLQRRRFELERQVLADLNHDGIARLIDGGTTPDGRPYLVMEYVEGVCVTQYCETENCDLRQRLELFQQVCHAVAHAHQLGVIHRDIKPANVLVNRQGVAKLVDFGIAKLTNVQPKSDTLALTEHGLLPFTPEYASPEQVSREPIGPSTDVYSLGVLLFELLTGSRLYQFATSSAQEIIQTICETSTPRPSQFVRRGTTHASNTNPDKPTRQNTAARTGGTKQIQGRISSDLDNVVLKAMRKEPERRYLSAAKLGEDIRRYQQGLPVEAVGDSVTYKVTKWTKRHRTLVTAAVLVFAALSIGFITAAVAWNRERNTANRLSEELYIADMNRGFEAMQERDFKQARQIVAKQLATPGIEKRSGVELKLLQTLTDQSPPVILPAHDGPVTELARVPGKPWVVSVGEDAQIQVWNAESGQKVMTLGTADGPLHAVAVSSDGKTVATGSQSVQLWDLESGRFQSVLANCPATVESLAFAPGDRELAVGVRYKDVSIHSLDDGPPIVVQTDGPRHDRLAFIRDGQALVVPYKDGTFSFLRVWDRQSRQMTQELLPSTGKSIVKHMAVSPDGRWIAATSFEETRIFVHDATTGVQVGEVRLNKNNSINNLAFSPDGLMLAGACDDGTVGIWQFSTSSRPVDSVTESPHVTAKVGLEQCDSFRADASRLNQLVFVDNRQLVTAGDDGAVKIWSIVPRQGITSLASEHAGFRSASMCFDPPLIAATEITLTREPNVRVRRLDEGNEWRSISPAHSSFATVALRPAGDLLATATVDGLIELWDVQTLKAVDTFRHTDRFMIEGLVFSPDGRLLASTGRDKSTCLWDVPSRGLICRWKHPDNAHSLAFCPKSKRLAIGTSFREVQIMDLRTHRLQQSLPITGDSGSLAWGPQGRRLAAGQKNGEIVIFDMENQTSALLPGDGSSVTSLTFSPDGKTLISGSSFGSVSLSHVASGRALGVLHQMPSSPSTLISALFFSPHNDQLIATTWSQESPVITWQLK